MTPSMLGENGRRVDLSLLAIVLVSLLWRLPSLFDPPWVNDEGTYFAVAQVMARGSRLYADVWENKPPGLYLLYSAVYHWFGASLVPIRLCAGLLTAVIVLLTHRLAVRPLGLDGARAAALLVGLLLGVPFLEGTTLNAELPLAALSALAMMSGVEGDRPGLAGVCMVTAVAFKAVAGFDAIALGIWLFIHRRHRLWHYTAAAALATAAGMLAVWRAGIVQPMIQDAFLYDVGYVGHANGGAFPWLLITKLAVLAGATAAMRRAPPFALWALWAVGGTLFSGRVFGHYALQSVVPGSLTLVWLFTRHKNRSRLTRRVLAAFATGAIVSALVGWSLAASGRDSIMARRLQYYANFARFASGQESYRTYSAQIDDHVVRNVDVASRLRHLRPGKALVWGNAPWIYVLSGRVPATAYTSALRQPEVPGETATLRRAVARHAAAVVVLVQPPLPPLGAVRNTLRFAYRREARLSHTGIYVLSTDR